MNEIVNQLYTLSTQIRQLQDGQRSLQLKQEQMDQKLENAFSKKESNVQSELMKKNIITLANNQKNLYELQNQLNDKINYISRQLRDMKEALDGVEEINNKVSNIDYNIINSSLGNGNDDYIRQLQGQFEKLKDDAFLKMMRNYIISTYCDLYSSISKRALALTGSSADELVKILSFIKNEMASIGVSLRSSPSGSKFDPEKMSANPDYSQKAVCQEDKGCIFTTIVPAFVWTIPVEGKTGAEMLLRKEEVALYF